MFFCSCVKEQKEKNTTNVSFLTLCEESHKCVVRDFLGQSSQQYISSLHSIEMKRYGEAGREFIEEGEYYMYSLFVVFFVVGADRCVCPGRKMQAKGAHFNIGAPLRQFMTEQYINKSRQ